VPEPNPSEVAPTLAAVLRRSLAKAKTDRWASAGAFADALSEAAAGVTPVSLESLPTLDLPHEEPDAVSPPHSMRQLDREREESGAQLREGDRGARERARWLWPLAGAAVALGALLLGGAALVTLLWRGGSQGSQAQGTVRKSEPAEDAVASGSRSGEASPVPATPSAASPSPVRGGAVAAATPSAVRTAATPAATPAAQPRPALEPALAPATATAPPDAAVPRPRSGPVRVYLEAKLEPVMFQKAKPKDVADSLKDLREAIPKREGLALAESRGDADAVVQVLERGREPAVIGVRKVRVRVVLGGETVELVGQDSMVTGFNTWSGAAGGTAKQVETWLARRLGSGEAPKTSR
jgi:hypothetical protein